MKRKTIAVVLAVFILSLFGSWVGRIFDSSIPTGGVYLAPYALVDASVAYVMRNVRVSMTIDNLFDKDFQQFVGFPARGRRARFEVAADI